VRCMILTLVAFAISCGPSLAQTKYVRAKGSSVESPKQYFPSGIFAENPSISAYKEDWYSSFLTAMDEPSLFETGKDSDVNTYRSLLILNAQALSFRLTVYLDGTGTLTTKRVVIYPDKASSLRVEQASVSEDKVREFIALLEKSGFWLSEAERTNQKNRYRLEGVQLVLEGVRNCEYHVVDRWSPKDPGFMRICIFLLKLSSSKPISKQNGAAVGR
jgi:hypothetical protein